MNRIKGLSLFSSAGIAETYFSEIGIDIVVANELLKKRADLYRYWYPETNMIQGSIEDKKIFDLIDENVKKEGCKFLIATPPCQGMSTLGKKDYENDERNLLVFYIFEMIDKNDFDYILIENVPKFLNLYFPFENKLLTLDEICKRKYSDKYIIETFVLNAANYGVPQSRPRGFVKIYKKKLTWNDPVEEDKISLRKAIGDLPSLESGESSNIKWHFAKKHNERDVLALRHTTEGFSAIKNEIYFPKKANGDRIKGFHNTYKRMKWDEPAPTRAINNGNIGGHNNVHPGRMNVDGTVSDARALTLRELFIVTSLPPELDLPEWCSDTLIRTVIGEAIPPIFCKNIVKGIFGEHDTFRKKKR